MKPGMLPGRVIEVDNTFDAGQQTAYLQGRMQIDLSHPPKCPAGF